MPSESIKKMRKAMIAKACKGLTLTQVKQIIHQLLQIDSDTTREFREWLVIELKEYYKKELILVECNVCKRSTSYVICVDCHLKNMVKIQEGKMDEPINPNIKPFKIVADKNQLKKKKEYFEKEREEKR